MFHLEVKLRTVKEGKKKKKVKINGTEINVLLYIDFTTKDRYFGFLPVSKTGVIFNPHHFKDPGCPALSQRATK